MRICITWELFLWLRLNFQGDWLHKLLILNICLLSSDKKSEYAIQKLVVRITY